MDSERFDRLTATLGAATSRRTAAQALAATLAGASVVRAMMPSAAVAATPAEDVETERCGGKRAKCTRNGECCDGLKCKGGDSLMGEPGKCKFKSGHGKKGDWCKKDSDCKSSLNCRERRCR